MDLSPFGITSRRTAVVLLGAGATAGSTLAHPGPLGRPFVDRDFFHHLAMLAAISEDRDFRKDVAELRTFLSGQYGHGVAGLEEIYADLDLARKFVAETKSGLRGRQLESFARNVDALKRMIVLVLRAEIPQSQYQFPRSYELDVLAMRMHSGDSVVSFNYDCLIDRSLQRVAGKKWKPDSAYGFPPAFGAESWAIPPSAGSFAKFGVQLLKPHGSLNWIRRPDGSLGLSADEFSPDASEVQIVPPSMSKDFESEPFGDVWMKTRIALRGARALMVIGYSLPQADSYTKSALRLECQSLDLLVLVNPDESANERLVEAVKSALTPKTRVVRLKSLGELVATFQRVPFRAG